LDEIRDEAQPYADAGGTDAQWVVVLIAELRASRARAQELQQRIDKALPELPDASTYTVGAENAFRVVFLLLDDIAKVRAALTGTEDETNG
jgi:hypothetical protein